MHKGIFRIDMHVLNDEGKEVGPNELGSMVLKNPLHAGTSRTLYKNDERFVQSYMTKFPGFYDTSDTAFFDDAGYVHIVGRSMMMLPIVQYLTPQNRFEQWPSPLMLWCWRLRRVSILL
jgi:acyl-coenzyme A synthetase/AMP-(fatty) acid ligase